MPNQWSSDGPGQQLPPSRERSWKRGSSGASSGAKMATKTNMPTSAKPSSAPRSRRSRAHASRQSPPLLGSSAASLASISATLNSA